MKALSRILTLVLLAFTATAAQSQDKPRWAIRGVDDINRQRTNESYRFVRFETFGADLNRLRAESTDALTEYIATNFGLTGETPQVESMTTAPVHTRFNNPEADAGVMREYRIRFNGPDPRVFYARLIDEYVSFDENVDMSYDYTLYQLYAVSTSGDGVQPAYDDISFTRSYNTQALVRSLVPGWGQFYKGQDTKAWCIIGGEVALASLAIYSDSRMRTYFDDSRANSGIVAESYWSKGTSWRTVRNIAIVGAVGIYVYNLLDAAISKGPRQVVVSKPSGTSLSVAPAMVYDPAATIAPGIGVSLTF